MLLFRVRVGAFLGTAVTAGPRNAPTRPRNNNTTQAAEPRSAAVTVACDDSTSELQPTATIIIAGDLKGGQECRVFFDSGQNYSCGISHRDLDQFTALKSLVRNYKVLEFTITVHTSGNSFAFRFVAHGVLKFNFYFGSPSMRWFIEEFRVNFIDQEQQLIPQSDLPRVQIGAQFLR